MQHQSITLTSVLLVLTVALSEQTLSYTLLSSEGPQPSARFDGTIAYDTSTRASQAGVSVFVR
jgi:hypothetical protein